MQHLQLRKDNIFSNFWDYRLASSLGYMNGNYLIHASIAAFYFCNIVELICSILTHPQINYFFYLHIYYLQVCFGTALYCGSKINIAKTESIKCKQLVLSVSVTLMVSMCEKWRSPWQPKQHPGSPASALNNISLRSSLITLYPLWTSEYPTLKVHAEF